MQNKRKSNAILLIKIAQLFDRDLKFNAEHTTIIFGIIFLFLHVTLAIIFVLSERYANTDNRIVIIIMVINLPKYT